MSSSHRERLAIVCTHPIQYYVPVFRKLSEVQSLETKVYYGWRGATEQCFDPDFKVSFKWDVDLLSGYESVFLDNIAKQPGSSHYSGICLPGIEDAIRKWQATSILVYGWCYQAHLQVMRRFRGKSNILFRGDSTLLDPIKPLKSWARRTFLRWVYSHVDVATYVGSNNRDYFLRHGIPESRLVFAPHAVDNQWFASQVAQDQRSLRKELGISDSEVMVLFVGKLESKKGPDLLVEAFNLLKNPGVKLVFAGSGELQASLSQQANSPGIHFLGFQNQKELPALYNSADLVILPSRGPGETWGLAINEAMACQKAVAASDRVGAARDLVWQDNGWIFQANNAESLCQTLREAHAVGRNGLASMGLNSAKIIQDWSIPAQVQGILKAIELARGSDRPQRAAESRHQ